jgi:hypothetical protein
VIFPIDTVAVQPATGRRSGGTFHTGICLVARLDGGDEAVAAPRDVYDEPVAIAPIVQRAAQRGNMDCKVGRLDKYVGPNPIHQFLLADQLTWSFKQHGQDLQSATPQAHRLVAFEQEKLRRAQAERPEHNFARCRDGSADPFPE